MRSSLPALLVPFVVACSAHSSSTTVGGDAGVLEPGVDGGTVDTSDGGGTTSPVGDGGRQGAVEQTIKSNAACTPLTQFYWEIGDVNGPIASGAVGTTVAAATVMGIASASKLVFGAYVLEHFAGDTSKIDMNAMRMGSGYVGLVYDACIGTASVSACFNASNNSKYVAADVGQFYYNGGHFQKYAVDLGLGNDDNVALANDVKAAIGTEFTFTYGSPQLAGGIKTSANDYAAFLRKILAGKLKIHDHLGGDPVCTEPGSSCAAALYSPAPAAWHYSYAHWVEDDPTTGDGAFSSPGAFGFYPWIDATKTYYGILARYAPLEAKAYVQSALCGAAIRKAFVTGVAQ
jgi:hypothetical protein